jgi:hypothetical protein
MPKTTKKFLRIRAKARIRAQDPEDELEDEEDENENEVAAQDEESQPATEETQPTDDAESKLRRIQIVAYTGGMMTVEGWPLPVVVDLSGLEIPTSSLPIRYAHDEYAGIGHTTNIAIEGNEIVADAVVSRDTEYSRDFLSSIENGFPWKASIGLEVVEYREIPDGAEVEVNGRSFTGPLYVVDLAVLREISIVDVPADIGTSVVAAKAARRVEIVKRILGKYPHLAERAIQENWSTKKCQLAAIRASRPSSRVVHAFDAGVDTTEVLTAAVMLRAGGSIAKSVEKKFATRIVDAASKYRNLGLLQLARECLRLEGHRVDPYSSPMDVIRAAFSVRSFPNLLRESAYRILVSTYETMPPTCLRIARIVETVNFMPHTLARLNAFAQFERVPLSGSIAQERIGDSGWQIKVDTYGRLFTITYQDVINDDLGAFLAIPQEAARGAIIALENHFWGTILANPGNFFSAANANVVTSAPLTIPNLDRAVERMLAQRDLFGQPVFVKPSFLVVPVGLKATAENLFTSVRVVITGNVERMLPETNAYAGQFEPVVTQYLPTNGANSTWYLVADPATTPAFAVAFLRGQETPIIEEVQPISQFLGYSVRAYWHFGVALLDHRAAVRATP